MLEDRNRTSHTYDEALAKQVYARLGVHQQGFETLLRVLQERVDS